MRKTIIATVISAAVFVTPSHAQYKGTLPANLDTNVSYFTDSDDFDQMIAWAGAASDSGFGARIGTSRYDGKYTLGDGVKNYFADEYDANFFGTESDKLSSDFSAQSTLIQLTYVKVTDNVDFHGAIGVRRLTHDTNITDAQREVIADAAELMVDMGLTQEQMADIKSKIDDEVGKARGTKDYLVADASLVLTMTDSLNIGISASTDVVDSVRGIQTGTTASSVGVDFDYVLDENLTVNVGTGMTHYSDDNDKTLVRAAMSWDMLPEYGISSYVRVRKYWNSDPWSVNYYAPEWLSDEVVGVRFRKAYDGLVYTASANYGMQQNAVLGGNSESKPVYGWELGVQTNPGRKTGITFGASIIGTNSAGTSGGDDYNWSGINFWLKAPL